MWLLVYGEADQPYRFGTVLWYLYLHCCFVTHGTFFQTISLGRAILLCLKFESIFELNLSTRSAVSRSAEAQIFYSKIEGGFSAKVESKKWKFYF